MHTEEQAKEMWCPFVRHTIDQSRRHSSTNRASDVINPQYSRCIGSQCMAWRFAEPEYDDFGARIRASNTGYCGLAGAPT